MESLPMYRPEGDDPIMGLKSRDVAEHLGQLRDPVFAIRVFGMFEPLADVADQTLLSVMTFPSLMRHLEFADLP